MNFFEHQNSARRRTKFLVLLYILSVVLIITFIYLALIIFIGISSEQYFAQNSPPFDLNSLWQPELLLFTTTAILFIVFTGTIYKVWQLRAGGSAVANSLGGRLIPTNTNLADERRIINIVEEIAIAAGIQVPAVYILDQEPAINAFAAGYKANQAVIGISRGCLNQLTRDELQGVIAHEFSHILNGDMRLNIRLIGILHGILLVVLTGRFLLESGIRGGRRRNSDEKNNAAPLIIIGLIFLIVGGIGSLAARLIKMAVSRQREFLADASAVQFTRSPWGIGGVLKKIAASSLGAELRSNRAEEISHMCFANALKSWFSELSLFSTHPPLLQRIKAIEPSFDGDFTKWLAKSSDAVVNNEVSRSSKSKANSVMNPVTPVLPKLPGFELPEIMVGALSEQALIHAATEKALLSEALIAACHEPLDASAIVCRLLISESKTPQEHQLNLLQAELPTAIFTQLHKTIYVKWDIKPSERLTVLELCISSMRQLSKNQYLAFKSATNKLINHDQQITIFEYALYKIQSHTLDQHFAITPKVNKIERNLPKILEPTTLLLYSLACFGNSNQESAIAAFNKACDYLGVDNSVRESVSLRVVAVNTLDSAIDQLLNVVPNIQAKIFAACVICIQFDNKITDKELDLIRVIGAMLGCPLPRNLSLS